MTLTLKPPSLELLCRPLRVALRLGRYSQWLARRDSLLDVSWVALQE
jgi:hypothetical protein